MIGKIYVKKVIKSVSLCILIGAFCFSFCFCFKTDKVASPPKKITVVIDAGHGGIDGGVSGVLTKVSESEINLSISKKLAKVFEDSGFTVVQTRRSSGGLYGFLGAGFKMRDMQAREKIIKESNPTLVISIHQNNFSDHSRRGAQVFYHIGREQSKEFAICMQQVLNKMEENAKKSSALSGDYYVLKVSPCPAIIIECGFLSNEQDEKLLLSEEYQQKLSNQIFYGCLQYLTSTKY